MKILTLKMLLVFLIAPNLLIAQSGKFYSTDKNLSNSLINAIFQDKKGFVWIATANGLNKFDGNKFTIYKHRLNDSLSLKNNYVRTVFEDSNGILWVGCINGLMRYDRMSDTFEEVYIYVGESRKNIHITCITESANGQIWFSTAGYGVFTIDKEAGSYKITHSLTDLLSGSHVSIIYEDASKNMWIATREKGVICYNQATGDIKVFDIPGVPPGNEVSAITGNKDGFIFIGTLTKGLSIYNPYENKIYPAPYKDSDGLFRVKSLLVKNESEVLIGTDGSGLKIYDLSKNVINDYSVHSPIDLSKAKIHSIMQDNMNNLWLGVFQKGVVFISGLQKGFEYIGTKLAGNNPIGNNSVSAMYKDKDDTMWVGTDNDGIFGINKTNKRVAHYTQSSYPNSAPNIIRSIFEDSNNDIWIGSYANGLAKLDRKTGVCRYIPELRNENIFSISEDKNKNLLIGTLGSGLYILDISGANKAMMRFPTDRDHTYYNLYSDDLCSRWITCVICDRDGLIWIGHYDGLSCYNPEKNTFINYIEKNNFIEGAVVMSLFEDYQGNIYAGTKDGIYYFNKKDTTLTQYTTQDGLSDNTVCGITDDDEHNLWLSTYRGLNKFDITSHEFTNYYAGDGLQGNEFSQGAVFKDNKGTIYFGGIYGITYFSPNKIVDNMTVQNLYITDFYLNNTPVSKGHKSGKNEIVSDAVIDAELFILSYNDNTFSLDLSTLDFTDPEQIHYQYKIEKLNSDWINLPPGMNRITHTNLPPGNYSVRIRALSNGTYSNEKQINIVITPPWYQTWWAYLIYTILVLMLIYGVISYVISRIRYRRKIAEKEQEKAISEAKLQFFTNLSHEIRTPMTLIISPLEKLIKENNDTEKQNTYILIYRNAQRILRLINQLMDIRKLDKGQMQLSFTEADMVEFIRDIMKTFEYLTQKKGIRFTFECDLDRLDVWIDLNNFDKVLMNILSNAFKYTLDNGEIQIKLSAGEDGNFEIKISDTGIGIDEQEIEKIFERFYQVNNAYCNFGTGIGLHLSRLLVEMHKGVLYAENRTDTRGSSFIIRLPLVIKPFNEQRYPNEVISKDSNKPELLYHEESTASNTAPKVIPKTKYHILVIEDDHDIRNYIKSELSSNYIVNTCNDGKEGLDYIFRENPDLVISDIMMPNMDGISLTRKIKTNINLNHIPVILLTAKSTEQDKLEGLETEADAYFEKPFNIEILKQTINNFISIRRTLKNKYLGNEKQEQLIQAIELKSSDEILMEKIMKVINEHLADPKLSVQMLSDIIGISRGHLHRKLKELTNQSVRDFIRGVRLKQAADLLASKKLSVSEVLYATGFSNLSHFSGVFKDFYGMSPTEYIASKASNSTD